LAAHTAKDELIDQRVSAARAVVHFKWFGHTRIVALETKRGKSTRLFPLLQLSQLDWDVTHVHQRELFSTMGRSTLVI
jgi:hypothetical protein